MLPSLKLSPIDREHLQEVYNEVGVARDDLPYTPAFDQLFQMFQDRTFKNAEPEQVYGALLKYTRSSGNAAGEVTASTLDADQLKQLKIAVNRYGERGKLMPFTARFNEARLEFSKLISRELSELEFWREIRHSQGARRKPPTRAKVVVEASDDDDGDDDE